MTAEPFIEFPLLVEFSGGGGYVKQHAQISGFRNQVMVDGNPVEVMYNGLQLRFTPHSKMFLEPLTLHCMCFDDMDPENPKIKDVYEKLEPFIKK